MMSFILGLCIGFLLGATTLAGVLVYATYKINQSEEDESL